MKTASNNQFADALKYLCGPLLDRGVDSASLRRLFDQALIELASERARKRNGKVHQAQVALITGLSRQRIRKALSEAESRPRREPTGTIGRLLEGWRRDHEFLTADGASQALRMRGDYGSFSSLSGKYAGDIPYKTILAELLRLRLVKVRNGRVALTGASPGMQTRAVTLRNLPRISDTKLRGEFKTILDESVALTFTDGQSLSLARRRLRQATTALITGAWASSANQGDYSIGNHSSPNRILNLMINVSELRNARSPAHERGK